MAPLIAMNDTDDSRNTQLDRLALALAVFKQYVEIKNKSQFQDNNLLAESLIADLLPLLSDWGNFINLNAHNPQQRGIDLLSCDGLTGVQVTVSRTADKVKHTLGQFAKLPNKPRELYIVMICGRLEDSRYRSLGPKIESAGIVFNSTEHILDLQGLFRLASNNSQARLADAIARLESEMGKRALAMLGSFNKNADRVLQVRYAHGIGGPQFNKILGLDPRAAPGDLTTPQGLQPWLTPTLCASIAEQFNVPLDWLNGTDDRTGDAYNSSPWRTSGDVMGLLHGIAERYRAAHFYIVTPEEIGNPFDSPQGSLVQRDDIPFLVFYKACGTYGDVFAHLGIQPWNIPHHRQAALFLGTVIRDFSRQGLGHFSVSWEQWPRDAILASCAGTLLVELMQQDDRLPLDERDAIRFNGRWEFQGQPAMSAQFNDEFLPTVAKGFEHLQQMEQRCRLLQERLDTQAAWDNIPPPAPGAKRIDGYLACDIAHLCQSPVRCADAQGSEYALSAESARTLISEQLEMAASDPKKRFIYLDIRVDPAAL